MIEIVINVIAMSLLWYLGMRVGLEGGKGLKLYILPQTTTLLQILYALSEFLVSLMLFIMLYRQTFPGGMKELSSGPTILASKSRYFPGIFALGVFAGLIAHAIVIVGLLLSGIAYY
jgi:hypothetical protein